MVQLAEGHARRDVDQRQPLRYSSIASSPSQAPLTGDLTNDTTGVIAGWNNTYAACAGKTIVSGGFVSDGSRYLTFSDGTSYTA